MAESVEIAQEYLDVREDVGEGLASIVMDVRVSAEELGLEVGWPSYCTQQDSVIFWLAEIYERHILKL
ncbi:MAG: hypothetical protein ACR2QF_00340 [Geminicoccaceae bacterium]